VRVAVVTAPDPVVTLDQAKAHLRVDHAEDDELIEGLVAAATQWIDAPAGWLGRAIGRQTLEVTVDGLCDAGVALPFPPISAVESVTYLDAAGEEAILADTAWRIGGTSLRPLLLPARGVSFPAVATGGDSVTVRIVCGWPTDEVPRPIRQAILLMVGGWYEDREATSREGRSAVPFGVEGLLSPFRAW
jgi:phage conserved hypothetical protein, phiE125 gp8 family